ncbi:MATE family efflux transporter [uncultured Thomasclavelia sp.]|uniref:MATE family efflux transporter n=1 Tax=uncultured Thomasclavelia sp. TaxID=3025759 RepID=UPI00280B9A90|nr:MATE family efflux transporter [uncultured Thomasclavelia sp.]
MKKYEIDMCNGPLLKSLIVFAVPLMLSGILQLLFNAADIIVLGRFSGSDSMAAVGSTTSLINLLVNLFIGISVGANVLLGRYCGANDEKNASQTVHTAICTALYGGIIMIFVGIILARPLLELMGTPSNVIDLSTVYMRIYFVGMPGFMIYNFGAALLRAIGDTKRPLYFLTIAGIVNVFGNLFFVLILNLGVAGVAISTTLSQYMSAILVLRCMYKDDGILKIHKELLHFHRDKLIAMLKIGLPAGLQGMLFNISNVLIQSSVNSFGSVVVAGNTAANNIEGFVYTAMNAVYQTALSFTSQNMGARNYKRVDKILINCLGFVSVVGLILGIGAYLGSDALLHIYSNETEVIKAGVLRMSIICSTYFTCGMMDVIVGSLRGMGYSIMPMIVSLTGACLFRVVWIFTIFAIDRSLFVLYISYPISWILTFGVHLICYFKVRKKAFNLSTLS